MNPISTSTSAHLRRSRVRLGSAQRGTRGAARHLLPADGPFAIAGATAAPSPDVVISEVYGGGGNSGATFTHDFIELYNRGADPVNLSGWSVQYASASGTTYQLTELSGAIGAGEHYLVQQNAGSGGTSPLPAPDATGSISMSASSAKVALALGASALTCGTSCAAVAGVRDFVGYGSANDFEGAAATPGQSNTTAATRDAARQDTDQNGVDSRLRSRHRRTAEPVVSRSHRHPAWSSTRFRARNTARRSKARPSATFPGWSPSTPATASGCRTPPPTTTSPPVRGSSSSPDLPRPQP